MIVITRPPVHKNTQYNNVTNMESFREPGYGETLEYWYLIYPILYRTILVLPLVPRVLATSVTVSKLINISLLIQC